MDPELLRRVWQRWSSLLVVPSDKLLLPEHWPSPAPTPPKEQKLWSLRLRVRFERLSIDDDDDSDFFQHFLGDRILSRFYPNSRVRLFRGTRQKLILKRPISATGAGHRNFLI
jgi:hypothetical protein